MISKNDFRNFLVALKQRFDLLVYCKNTESSEDTTIFFNDFLEAIPNIKKQIGQVKNPENEFKKLDKQNTGEISFDILCEWAIKTKLKNDDI